MGLNPVPKLLFSEHRQDIVAGLTTFAAMSYIIFANPAILDPIGMPAGPVLLWTCVIAFLATAVAGLSLGTPTALACGMGLNVFFADYAKQHDVPWQHLLATCAAVSILVFLLSIVGWRKNVLMAVPPQIFAAIKAGVGGLLVKVATTEVIATGTGIGHFVSVFVFLLGLTTIVLIKLSCAMRIDAHPNDDNVKTSMTLLDSASYFLSVIVMILLCTWINVPASEIVPEANQFLIWIGAAEPLSKLTDNTFWILCIPFAIVVFFVLMMDIAGSPLEYVQPGRPGFAFDEPRKNTIIDRSLKIDSGFNIAASIAGVTPIVYYAENHVGWKAGGRSGWTAAIVAGGFFLFAVLGAISIGLSWPISEWIPKFAIMPALFFVGLLIIAESFAQRFTRAGVPQRSPAGPVAATADEIPINREYYFIPAAVTVVMVSNSSFDYAIAAGILSYAVISAWPESYVGKPEAYPGARAGNLSSIYLAAAVVLIINLIQNSFS